MPDRIKNQFAINSPHQLALGVTVGVVIGLMPKDSVIPWALGLLLLFSRGNLLTGIAAILLASLVGPLLDGITDKLGESVLSVGFMQSYYAAWMDVPWMAWTRFNNTVVAGSLMLGFLSALPVYLLSQLFFRVWGIDMIQRVMDMKLIRVVFGETQANLESQEASPMPEA